jgi:ribosomal protein L12E/L44/L45/RPP1/RPP2
VHVKVIGIVGFTGRPGYNPIGHAFVVAVSVEITAAATGGAHDRAEPFRAGDESKEEEEGEEELEDVLMFAMH